MQTNEWDWQDGFATRTRVYEPPVPGSKLDPVNKLSSWCLACRARRERACRPLGRTFNRRKRLPGAVEGRKRSLGVLHEEEHYHRHPVLVFRIQPVAAGCIIFWKRGCAADAVSCYW